ncbi:alpha/beta fold hydrolase [Rhodococcus erythropolis]|uniref:Putative esterase n=1 Tax=Rhodococcus erythropolis (strain PR4 / NBRC 100887) TaxID=234621 RepID=C0ZQ56_RHOE4|nr:alpha/beta hydrolase [Rhodococcus erythropolis]BAH31534.1 putative esterase [Rhodococcus erythropolis PR4]
MNITSKKPTFVLVHGGRHGGWSWQRVADRLRAEGHGVYAPTLTGLGDRAHLASREVGLDTHVKDLVAVFEFEDLTDVVLVMHSYGGMVGSGATEVIGDRVRSVVFLDAVMPRSGESVLDLQPPGREERIRGTVEREGDGWLVPASDASYWGITDPDDLAWVNPRITAQPFKTYTDRLGEVRRVWEKPTVFILCQNADGVAHIDSARALERSHSGDSNFELWTLVASHDAMVTHTEDVAGMLLAAAEREVSAVVH